MPQYDLQPTRDYCRQLGMGVDEPWFPVAMAEASVHGLTQDQFNAAMRLHAWHVKSLFDPGRYTLLQRIAVSGHFLFGKADPMMKSAKVSGG